MKLHKAILCVVIVSLLVSMAIPIVSAPKPGGKPGKPPKDEEKIAEGEETRITYEEYDQTQAAIFGDKIVWIDGERSHFSPDISQIWRYDIANGEKYQVTFSESKKCCPAIYNDKIVWEDKRSEEWFWDIYMYDLTEGQEYPITSSGNALSPDIYENKIVYRSYSEVGSDIIIYDISTGEEVEIPEEYSRVGNPKIFGNKVVYQVETDGDTNPIDTQDIVIYNLDTGDRTHLYKDGNDMDVAIYGDVIVWMNCPNPSANFHSRKYNIWMYNIVTGEETQLTGGKPTQTEPDIYENMVVWMDYRNDNWDIYMYDLGPDGEYGTGDDGEGEYRVTTNEGSQKYPRVFGNNIVYEDYRWEIPPPYNWDIYMFTLAQ